jgi:hypothetical protein
MTKAEDLGCKVIEEPLPDQEKKNRFWIYFE